MINLKDDKVKKIVKQHYANVATADTSCCSCGCTGTDTEQISKSIGYSEEEIGTVPEANLGLGCGNPVALGEFNNGDVVLDLGSGAGIDCFLAAKKVGPEGKVIGVDMTEEMVEKARQNAEKYDYNNVEFRLGYIDELPVEDSSIDVIISNCVINLAPDKLKVFMDAFRVLKAGGRMYISDIVLLRELSEEDRNNKELLAGCVAGALLKDEYLGLLKKAGFEVEILGEDRDISKRQYQGYPLESLKVGAYKV